MAIFMATVYRLVGLDISVYQFESTENGVSSKFNALGWLAGELAENATLQSPSRYGASKSAPIRDIVYACSRWGWSSPKTPA